MKKIRFLPKEHKVTLAIVFVLFAIYAVSLIYPLCWVFTQSLRTEIDFFWHPLDMPKKITFENYKLVFESYSIIPMFTNSLILALGGAFATIMSSCVAAYVVSRYSFIGRNFIYALVIFIMIIPATGSMAATYRLMNDSGLAGKHIGLIIKGAGGFDFSFLLLYSFFKNLSMTYSEAAELDGAGHFQIFYKIMLPLVLPSVTAVGIVSFIGHWNDYFTPYMYLREYPTLAVGIYLLSSDITSGADSNYPALFAIMIISIVPVLIIFGIFQDKIVKNTIAGGIKG